MQAQRIQQAVNDGADAILISCSDAGKVTGAINDAVDRGVAVMTFDSDAPQSKRFAYYGVDDVKTGQQTMAELAKLMNGKGKVAILAGNQNAPNLQHRVQGAKEEAAKHPGHHDHRRVQPRRDAAGCRGRGCARQQRVSGHSGLGDDRRLAAVHADRCSPISIRRASRSRRSTRCPSSSPTSRRAWCRCCSRSRCTSGATSASRTIVDKLHFKKDVPTVIPMELVRVSKDESRHVGAGSFRRGASRTCRPPTCSSSSSERRVSETAAVRFEQHHEALSRRAGAGRRLARDRRAARVTRSAARTAPGRARSERFSPASTRPTADDCSSTDARSLHRTARRACRRRRHGAPGARVLRQSLVAENLCLARAPVASAGSSSAAS